MAGTVVGDEEKLTDVVKLTAPLHVLCRQDDKRTQRPRRSLESGVTSSCVGVQPTQHWG